MLRTLEWPAFRRQLLAWFRRHQRALPFRGSRDPYRIWLSEVMLQQTRVAAALPYYRRFLRRFPSVRALARAREQEVLRHWAGLGYYSRARNLRRAAKIIVAQHSGEFPRTLDQALALPGVGRYTAPAVLSIAFGQPLAVLDGNVARVLARMGALRGDVRAPRRWNRLQSAAQELMDSACDSQRPAKQHPGDWNQALMELGALVCTPRAPRCEVCPVAKFCRARQLGVQEEIPAPRRKRRTERTRIAAAVFLDPQGRTLLVRPPAVNGNLFSGLWQFPAVEVNHHPRRELLALLQNLKRKDSPSRTQKARRISELKPLPSARHAVTYRAITLFPFLVRVERLPSGEGARTVRLAKLGALPVSGATRKIAQTAREELHH
jgi:A/G-specific adenine glycosylase